MHEINFGLAGDVELVIIYNASKTISVSIFSSHLFYCSPFFTELIGSRFQSSALASSFIFYQDKK